MPAIEPILRRPYLPHDTFWWPLTFFAARTMAGMSQPQLAKAAGMCRTHISKIERATLPSLALVERLAAAMGMTSYKLILIYDFLTSPQLNRGHEGLEAL